MLACLFEGCLKVDSKQALVLEFKHSFVFYHLFFNISLHLICACEGTWMFARVRVWSSEDLVLSFDHVGPRDWSQVVRPWW